MHSTATSSESATGDVQRRILTATAALIREQGPAAATTRAVAAAASVQAPTIYRLFGDKDALLDAVAEHVLADYVISKQRRVADADPIAMLRNGWDHHVAFGLANPALFWIISRNAHSPAAVAGRSALAERIHAIALAGQLRGNEERAAAMVHAACVGVVLTLIAGEGDIKSSTLSDDTRDAVISAMTVQKTKHATESLRGAATTLRAKLRAPTTVLTPGERGLMDELLVRLSNEG